ncbi:MAG: hypothetical protein ACXVH2_02870 [Methanobacterium sp.]
MFGAIIGVICAIIVLMLENKIFKENDSTS